MIKMTEDKIDQKYYINVAEIMSCILPRPRLKRTILADHDEWLPIIVW